MPSIINRNVRNFGSSTLLVQMSSNIFACWVDRNWSSVLKHKKKYLQLVVGAYLLALIFLVGFFDYIITPQICSTCAYSSRIFDEFYCKIFLSIFRSTFMFSLVRCIFAFLNLKLTYSCNVYCSVSINSWSSFHTI